MKITEIIIKGEGLIRDTEEPQASKELLEAIESIPAFSEIDFHSGVNPGIINGEQRIAFGKKSKITSPNWEEK